MDSIALHVRSTRKLFAGTSRLFLAVATALALFAVVPRSASADQASDEQALLSAMNSERAGNGLPPIAFDRVAADRVARPWAGAMASRNTLSHNPNYRAEISARVSPWSRTGENVGYSTAGAGDLHRRFMASSGHRANILGDYNRVGIGVAHANGKTWATVDFIKGAGDQAMGMSTNTGRNGYLVTRANGAVKTFGGIAHRGDMTNQPLSQPVVGAASTPSGNGYWLVAGDGGIFSFGDAPFLGSTGGQRLNRSIVGIASTPTGGGYWLVASDGGIFTFGDARFHGSTGGHRLNSPIVGMSNTPSSGGYWLVAADGGIFTFGDAAFHGSTGGQRLNKPVVGMASIPAGTGYWLVASDGGIFSFNAGFFGSAGGSPLNASVVGMAAGPRGYWLVAGDGGIFNYGAPFQGSAAG